MEILTGSSPPFLCLPSLTRCCVGVNYEMSLTVMNDTFRTWRHVTFSFLLLTLDFPLSWSLILPLLPPPHCPHSVSRAPLSRSAHLSSPPPSPPDEAELVAAAAGLNWGALMTQNSEATGGALERPTCVHFLRWAPICYVGGSTFRVIVDGGAYLKANY